MSTPYQDLHPYQPCPAIYRLQASCTLQADSLQLGYLLQGDLAQLRIPPPRLAQARDGLWQYSCFEVFIGVQDSTAYHEFNFSPSGEWAGYAFSTYRQQQAWTMQQTPAIQCHHTKQHLHLSTQLAVTDLPDKPQHQAWQIGLTAVIELHNGEKSYWALTHPCSQPDFHHRDGFIHEIWP